MGSRLPRGRMIVLNGGSSSGKTTLARALQQILPGLWLRWSIDDLVEAMPRKSNDDGAGIGIEIGRAGEVIVGPELVEALTAWRTGLAAMVGAGVGIVLDDVFLDGGRSQDRLRRDLGGLEVMWVGVRCDPRIAMSREAARGDRPIGMAASQAEAVHQGVTYDVEVDTGTTEPTACARVIAAALRR